MNTDANDLPASDTPADRVRIWAINSGKVLRYAAQRASEKKLPQVASSLTFTTVLAIVPLLAVVLSLFTAFPLFADFKDALEGFLTSNLMPPTVSDTVMSYLNQFAAKASGLTTVGAVFLIVVSVMLIMTIDTAFNDIWHVEQQRPMRQRMLVYWAIISLGPVLAGASLWTTSYLARESLGRVQEIAPALNVVLSFVPLVITGLGFAALFVTVPNRQVYWRDALAGGFGTAIVLEIMKSGFALYITRFPSYTIIYGAFATLPIFLLWIYLSWLAVLFGATVAATLPSLRLRRWAENRQPGSAFVDAINVMRTLRSAQGTPSPGRSLRFLSAHLRLHPDELLVVLRTLKRLGYVVPTHEKGAEQWALTCDVRDADLGRIIDALLIDRSQIGLLEDPGLLDAVSASLAQSLPVTLEQLMDAGPGTDQKHNETLSESTVMMQNSPKEAHQSNQEAHHVESQ
ncbi:MAG TPA: YihY family inner membrane protein [Eoetvoesiella sp.]|jgi:membrane protein|uniref:YihY family inner membrane protein n=1 Tax=Eoetvoesiella sp. TaxID=1966355 RepID=UPI002C8DB748|nr:YihY family inner membrane protein [Eoetvoesiella sp.]HWK62757.1 YihY family inner membrane protein [Eoetvoesiella sp.]